MNILKTFQKRLSLKKPIASILFVGALMLIIFYYFNKTIFTNMNSENFENNGQKKVVYFYMNGCGHCNNFTPIWDQFCSANSSSIKTYKFEQAQVQEQISSYSISGFPTILLLDENNAKIDEYSGERSVEALTSYVNSRA